MRVVHPSRPPVGRHLRMTAVSRKQRDLLFGAQRHEGFERIAGRRGAPYHGLRLHAGLRVKLILVRLRFEGAIGCSAAGISTTTSSSG